MRGVDREKAERAEREAGRKAAEEMLKQSAPSWVKDKMGLRGRQARDAVQKLETL
jgi:hypothetical protein